MATFCCVFTYICMCMFNKSHIIIIIVLFHFTCFAQTNKKIDSLIIKTLSQASDTSKVVTIKNILGNNFDLYKDRFDFIPSINPLNPKNLKRISSKFGKRFHPVDKRAKQHLGIDISSKKGTPVHASAAGTVIATITSNYGYGNQVVVQHEYGFITRYAHLHSFIIKEGDTIPKGKIIGFVGNSGKSTGYHLHYEIHKFDKPIDPYPFCFLDVD